MRHFIYTDFCLCPADTLTAHIPLIFIIYIFKKNLIYAIETCIQTNGYSEIILCSEPHLKLQLGYHEISTRNFMIS